MHETVEVVVLPTHVARFRLDDVEDPLVSIGCVALIVEAHDVRNDDTLE